MDSDQIRKLMKRVAVAGAFFLVALLFYFLGWRKMLLTYAILVTVAMVLAILLQSGRGGGLASLGGMGGENLLGARAATPIAKATYVMGGLFLFICMLISRMGQVRAEHGVQELSSDQAPPAQEQVETGHPAQPGMDGGGGEEDSSPISETAPEARPCFAP